MIQRPDVDVNNHLGDALNPFEKALKSGHPNYAVKISRRKDFARNNKRRFDANDTLYEAAYMGWTELAKEIIRRDDYNPNKRSENRSTDLMFGIQKGWSDEVLDELLNRSDIDVSLKNFDGKDALYYAYSNKKLKLAAKILKRRLQKITPYTRLPQEEALLIAEVKQTMLPKAKQKTSVALSELVSLMESDRIEEFKERLKSIDFDINMRFDDNFLENKSGHTLLERAMRPNKCDFFDILLERDDINPNQQNSQGHTILMQAIDSRYNEIAKKLLTRKDINLNLEDEEGLTAISHAINKKNDEMFYILVQNPDVDINHTTSRYSDDENPFTQAINHREPHYALKIAQRADFAKGGSRKFDINRAFCIASDRYEAESVAYEIIKREDYNPNKLYRHNPKDLTKQTDLMYVIENHDWEFAQELLNRSDIDVTIKDSKGRDALDYAKETKNQMLSARILKRKEQGVAPYIRNSQIAIPQAAKESDKKKRDKITLTQEQLMKAQKLRQSLTLELELPPDINKNRKLAKTSLTKLLYISCDFLSTEQYAKLAEFIEDDDIMRNFNSSICLLDMILASFDGKQIEDSKHDLLELTPENKLPIPREYDILYNLFYFCTPNNGEDIREEVEFLKALSIFDDTQQMTFLSSYFPRILNRAQKQKIMELCSNFDISLAVKDSNLDILDFIMALYLKPNSDKEDFLETLAQKRQENPNLKNGINIIKIDNDIMSDMKTDLTMQKAKVDIQKYIAYKRRQKVMEQTSHMGVYSKSSKLFENMDMLY